MARRTERLQILDRGPSALGDRHDVVDVQQLLDATPRTTEIEDACQESTRAPEDRVGVVRKHAGAVLLVGGVGSAAVPNVRPVAMMVSIPRDASAEVRFPYVDGQPAAARAGVLAAVLANPRCQFAAPCRHPICRVMQPEGRVERPPESCPVSRAGSIDKIRPRDACARESFAGSCSHPAGRPSPWRRPEGVAGQRRRRGRARAFCAGEGGVGPSASSFGLSLGRYDSPSMTKS